MPDPIELKPDDEKLVTLARSARARNDTAEGAAVRDDNRPHLRRDHRRTIVASAVGATSGRGHRGGEWRRCARSGRNRRCGGDGSHRGSCGSLPTCRRTRRSCSRQSTAQCIELSARTESTAVAPRHDEAGRPSGCEAMPRNDDVACVVTAARK